MSKKSWAIQIKQQGRLAADQSAMTVMQAASLSIENTISDHLAALVGALISADFVIQNCPETMAIKAAYCLQIPL